MKRFSLAALFLGLATYLFAGNTCGITISSNVQEATCFGTSDGSISLTVSGGSIPQTSNKGLIISEFLADPSGNDSPNEFVELLATKDIDFGFTPYTVIFNNNNTATANGWAQGNTITYAFEISSGFVSAGDVIYVGGSGMIPVNNVYRAINYTSATGDGGIGNASATSGVLGNGGANADGIAVFDVPVNLITSSTVPVDAVFFGAGLGNAVVNNGADGYQLPVNDLYNGGKLQSTSFFINNNPLSGQTIKASGEYDITTNTFTTPRTWVNNATFSDGLSDVGLAQLYTYQWDNSATTQNIENLSAGQYCVTITDASACSITECFNVLEPDEISPDLTFLDASCFGFADGGALTLILGGTSPFTYSWSNGATTQNLSGVVAGDYFLTVTDDNGCTAEATAFIAEPDPIEFDLFVDNVKCFGEDNGIASVQNLSGGSGNFDFLYSEVNGTIGITDGVGNAAEITPGEYKVVVYETNNPSCFLEETFFITEPDPITINASITPITCTDDDNAAIEVLVTGGSAPFSFEWADDPFALSNERNDLAEGTYEVTVSDDNSCSATASLTIVNPSPLEVTFNVTDASAQNAADGEIEVNIQGGIAQYDFSWSNNETTATITGLVPDEYCVTVTDANGCEVSDCAEVDFAVGINELNNDIAVTANVYNNVLLAGIQYAEKTTLSAEVYSVDGKLMLAETLNESNKLELQHNVSYWNKGLYIIRFSANNNTLLKKVMLQ